MSMNHKPAWMEDELVKNIPERKLAFLEKLYVEGHNTNKKDMKRIIFLDNNIWFITFILKTI